ncbi:MAG TPA: NUDIX hydrolase [Ktedonobacterales bacterium]
MISFTVDGVRFNLRAAAVIIDEGHVLLHRASYEAFWSLPGGRVEAGESAAATVARELAEELGPTLDARVERLLWVIENFFRYEGTQCHELGMYYLVTLGASSSLLAKDRIHDGIEDDLPLHEGEHVRLIFQWFPLDSLVRVPLYPTLLRTRLANLPTTTELVTHIDPDVDTVAG